MWIFLSVMHIIFTARSLIVLQGKCFIGQWCMDLMRRGREDIFGEFGEN